MNNSPVIVVAAYNRPTALKRLLAQLNAANYDGEVTLYISIDDGAPKEVINTAHWFEWDHGLKEVFVQMEHLGLRHHIITCADLTLRYGSIILLEDDLGVSPWFYQYACKALDFYQDDKNIAGISLYSYAVAESTYQAFSVPSDGSDNYFMQFPSSWGQAWTEAQWTAFSIWLAKNEEKEVPLPAFVKTWSGSSWKRDYLRYMIDTNKFFIYPTTSLTTNYGDKGENFSMDLHLYQVELEQEKKEYNFSSLAESKLIYSSGFRLASDTSATPPKVGKIEQAEYKLALEQGRVNKGIIGHGLFIGRYTAANYWNMLRKKFST